MIIRNIIMGLFLGFLFATKAAACTCSGTSLAEQFLDVDLVFEGRVISSEVYRENSVVNTPGTASYSVTAPQSVMVTAFEVVRPLKGRSMPTRTVIHSRPTGGNCGIGFEEGKSYRVFAYRYAEQYSTSGCTHSAQLGSDSEYAKYRKEALEEILADDSSREEREEALKYYGYFQYEDLYEEQYDEFLNNYEWLVTRATQRESLDYFFHSADELEKWKDYENLAVAYVAASKLAPDNTLYLVGAGNAFLKLEKYQESLAHFAKALELDPNNLLAQSGHAKANLVVNKAIDKSISDYRDLVVEALDLSEKRSGIVDLSGGEFGELRLADGRISHLRLVRAEVYGGSFKGAVLRSARLDAAEFADDVDLSLVDFSYASLNGGKFLNVNFKQSNFTGADGRNGMFERSDLSGVRFDRSNFSNAFLSGANMTDAVLGTANFQHARLGHTILAGTDLRRVNLEGADTTGARVSCKTKLPKEMEVREAQLIPIESTCGRKKQNRDFSDNPWDYDDFSGLDLKSASFVDAHFNQTKFHRSQLQAADFSRANGRASFMGSDLTGASFKDANLRATFHQAATWEERETVIPAAILNDVDFTGAKITTSMFLGGDEFFNPEPKVSTAVFENATLECSNKIRLRDIKTYEEEEYKEYWPEDVDPERKAASEDRAEREYDYAIRWLVAEGAFVKALKLKWPSIELGEECKVHFSEALPYPLKR